ncbi:hypothetical protein SERLA73DRAFT_166182 [Serpula lacrymans var. lacrymans S7.3]|uniref:Major facilitator superfamily (MFS) profile domain-containing protein n=2 Tax=Serpula lacrymans var. lacrymans TaxID=341189 RepID=F8PQS1_SERL3|nr:uncharacterized protein SERLADRAFT_366830 [Serpula lacrymans var. lacrymans S7.9]EGO01631.1 hypothetical protein SERLA73DRAFT_166182 [Serpula lacrymans var. lacrymans S7.3]EGO27286.1 hypothetical protein SERLADRAFT_366830 [Serpula lacrymans var. lacrymans S7.9]
MDHLKPKTYTARFPRWMVGKRLLYASSALASLGDAMFGYSQGIIAAAQVQPSVQAGDTGVEPFTQAITVACINITALLASFGAAYVCDILGRRMSVRIGAIIYLIAAFIQLFSPNLAALIVGRSIQGLGVGMLSMTVPILQCEIAPGHARGLFVSIEYFCLNFGYAISAWVAFAFVLVVWTFFLPETPRWLIRNGFRKEGLGALADLHGTGDITDPHILATYIEIVAAIDFEETMGEATWRQLFTQYTRRSIVGITCHMFAQLNGINAILYFLPENLTRAGFTISRSLLFSGACALIYCSGTIPTMFLIHKWGRKTFLITGSLGLAGSLAIVGGLQFHADSLPEGPARLPTADGLFLCWGPTPWLLGAEISPLRARAKGMSLSTSTNWLFNFIVAFITPPLFSAITAGYYFLLLGFCLISGAFVWLVYVETAHRTLEELGELIEEATENMRRSPSGLPADIVTSQAVDSQATLMASIERVKTKTSSTKQLQGD